MTKMIATPDVIIDFVFRDAVHASDGELERHIARWFHADSAFDHEIAEKFGATIRTAIAGELDHFVATPQGRLALMVLLDQFTRNIFRNTPQAFIGDGRALAFCRGGVALGVDQDLNVVHRHFFYLPLLHAEDRAAQVLSVDCFEQLARDAPTNQHELFGACANAARRYRDIIFHFGRFPHRNETLGRDPTEEERQLMQEQTGAMPRYANFGKRSPSHSVV